MSSPASATKYKIAPVRGSSGGSSNRRSASASKKKDPAQLLKDALKAREDDVARLSGEIELLKDTVGALMTENRMLKGRYAHVVKHVLAAHQHADGRAGGAGDGAADASAARGHAPLTSGGVGVAAAERPLPAGTDGNYGYDENDPDSVRALATDPLLVVQLVQRLADERAETLRMRSTLEPRVEELETRLTEQSWRLARLTARDSYCADVVDSSLVDDSASLAEVREKLSGLQQNLVMEHPLLEDPRRVPLFALEPAAADHAQQLASLLAAESRALPYALSKPLVKLPGDTHIKAMHPDLRNFVMHQLSMERASGADWRALAERVGIDAATVDSWRRLRLPCPMSQVLAFWGDSAGATVRMLHRHLMSPQLRAIVVAKRIGDFYDVS